MRSVDRLFCFSEVELLYRQKIPPGERPIIKNSHDAYNLLLEIWDLNRIELIEQVNMLLFDHGKSCLGVFRIATGGITSCIVDPRIVFSTALAARATGIIVAHNHPSGNLYPSQADISLTSKLMDAGKLLDIRLLDHIIMTQTGYYSFTDEGLIP